MIALIIIGAIALCLLLLLICPLKVQATMNGEFGLKIKYGPLKITIMPKSKEKPPKKKKEKPKKEKPKKEKAEGEESGFKKLLNKHGISGLLNLAKDAVKMIFKWLFGLLGHIVVYHLHFGMTVGSDNAFDTATQANKMSTIADAAANVVLPFIPAKKRKDIQWKIVPDFTTPQNNIYLYAEVGIRPLFVFGYIFLLIGKALILLKKLFFPKKQKVNVNKVSEQPQANEQAA